MSRNPTKLEDWKVVHDRDSCLELEDVVMLRVMSSSVATINCSRIRSLSVARKITDRALFAFAQEILMDQLLFLIKILLIFNDFC